MASRCARAAPAGADYRFPGHPVSALLACQAEELKRPVRCRVRMRIAGEFSYADSTRLGDEPEYLVTDVGEAAVRVQARRRVGHTICLLNEQHAVRDVFCPTWARAADSDF